MSSISNNNYNEHVFEMALPRIQQAEIWKSEGPEINADAARLQKLFDSKDVDGYQEELDKLKSTGRQFRMTEGHVFEILDDPSAHMNVPIKIQVKEGCLTWYFEAPHDITKQSFRDEVFLSAGLGHVGVDHARFRYMRGTNSLHVKQMHTDESESQKNHNHYVLDKGQLFTPERFKAHIDGFVKAEQELNLMGDDGKEKFLTQGEADQIVKAYTEHWEKITAKDNTGLSILERMQDLNRKRWTQEDRHEHVKYNYLLNTVTSCDEEKESEQYLSQKSFFTIKPDWPLAKRIEAVGRAMRGGFSNRAHVRQMAGSKLPPLPELKEMDDKVQKRAIPQKQEKSITQEESTTKDSEVKDS